MRVENKNEIFMYLDIATVVFTFLAVIFDVAMVCVASKSIIAATIMGLCTIACLLAMYSVVIYRGVLYYKTFCKAKRYY